MTLLLATLGILAVNLAPTQVARAVSRVVDGDREARVSVTHWPARVWTTTVITPRENVPHDVDEVLYLERLLLVMEDGISNRLNMAGALDTRHSADEYRALYDVYVARQTEVLARLDGLRVPDRLRPVHDWIRAATHAQIEFYGAFVAAKVRDRATDLRAMTAHPALTATTEALRAAWADVEHLSPALDPAARDAIYQHLTGLDVRAEARVPTRSTPAPTEPHTAIA